MKKIPVVMIGLGIALFVIITGIQAATLKTETLRQDVVCAGKENSLYAVQNQKNNYMIYHIDSQNSIQKVFLEKNRPALGQKNILFLHYENAENILFALGKWKKENGQFTYLIRKFSDTLEPLEKEYLIMLPNRQALSLYYEEEQLMLFAVSEDGKKRYHYRISLPTQEDGQYVSCTLTGEGDYEPQQDAAAWNITKNTGEGKRSVQSSFAMRLLLMQENILQTILWIGAVELLLIPLAMIGVKTRRRLLQGFIILYIGFLCGLSLLYQYFNKITSGGAWQKKEELWQAIWLTATIGTVLIWLIYWYIGIGLWRTLQRLEETSEKQKEKLRYECNMLIHSCQRFIPMKLIELLEKQSILELEEGDRVTMRAAVAIIPLIQPQELALIQEICACRQGILFQDSCNLTLLKAFFLEESAEAVAFAAEVLNILDAHRRPETPREMILLHEGEYIYGITGTKEQVFPFLRSQQLERLEHYQEELCKLGLRLVMTQKIAEAVEDKRRIRYIGYLTLPKRQEKLRLYESLEVYEEKQCSAMLQTREVFEKALQLFYGHDFYLARYHFTEVLKEWEKDGVARWYLLRCEQQLDKEYQADTSDALFL